MITIKTRKDSPTLIDFNTDSAESFKSNGYFLKGLYKHSDSANILATATTEIEYNRRDWKERSCTTLE